MVLLGRSDGSGQSRGRKQRPACRAHEPSWTNVGTWRSQGYGYWSPRRGRPGHLLRLRGQKRPVPPARLAARRHGRPHARQRLDPRRHDGRRGRLPCRPLLPDLHARGPAGHRHRGHDHALHRRHDRHHRHRHQARAGLFDRQPVGLHDAGPGPGRLAGRHVPPVHARLLQVPAVSLLRVGDPRHGHQRNAGDGRPAEEDALDGGHDARGLPGDRGSGHTAGRGTERLLLQGRHPGPGPVVQPGQSAVRLFLLDRHRGGRDHGLLHVPPVVHDLCRRAPRRTRLSPRPRVAMGDGRAAGGPRLLRHRCRLDAQAAGQLSACRRCWSRPGRWARSTAPRPVGRRR